MANKGQRDRRGHGRAAKDVARLDADERTIRHLTAVLASFETWKTTGVLPEIPDMTLEDWTRAEQLLEGAA